MPNLPASFLTSAGGVRPTDSTPYRILLPFHPVVISRIAHVPFLVTDLLSQPRLTANETHAGHFLRAGRTFKILAVRTDIIVEDLCIRRRNHVFKLELPVSAHSTARRNK